MGSVYNRGTKHEPRYYVRYKNSEGRWVSSPSHQPTKAAAEALVRQIEARIAEGKVGIERPEQQGRCAELLEQFAASLTNRSAADDRGRMRLYLLPVFADKALRDVTLHAVMRWLDTMKAEAKLSPASQRHCLNLLSRFFSWAIERGHATVNPVRQIPTGKRPQQPQKRDTPWLEDDATVRKLVHALPEPINLMFYLSNRSGLRLGESAGLRMSDLEGIANGSVRVRFSYDGPLKEDKTGAGKVKWAPAAEDAAALLEPWLAKRRAEGAGPESLAFPCATRGGRTYRRECIRGHWERATKALGLELTWYQATRHSFVTCSLRDGASLDEVSAAVGHSSPVVTRRYYDHHVRRSFSPELRRGLGLGNAAGLAQIIPLQRRTNG